MTLHKDEVDIILDFLNPLTVAELNERFYIKSKKKRLGNNINCWYQSFKPMKHQFVIVYDNLEALIKAQRVNIMNPYKPYRVMLGNHDLHLRQEDKDLLRDFLLDSYGIVDDAEFKKLAHSKYDTEEDCYITYTYCSIIHPDLPNGKLGYCDLIEW